jgi:hypothetical protein
MRIDLFDVLDGLIRGVIYFIYNLFYTTAVIIQHPIKGPATLHRLHLRPTRRQIAGVTYLFVSFFAWNAMLIPLTANNLNPQTALSWLAGKLNAASLNAPSLDLNAFWPTFISSLVSTVLIDAALRYELRQRLRGPARREQRELTVGATEYALVWMLLVATVSVIVPFALRYFVSYPMWLIWTLLGLMFASLMASEIPAVLVVKRAIQTSGASRRWRKAWNTAKLIQAVFALFIVAMMSGTALGVEIQKRRDAAAVRAGAIGNAAEVTTSAPPR